MWNENSFKYIAKKGLKVQTGKIYTCSGCGIISDPLYIYCPYCGQQNNFKDKKEKED